MTYPVFSPKFSSAGKGPFIAGKVKNMHQRCTFHWGGGQGGEWSERHGLTLGGTKFLEIPFSHFKTSFAHTGHCQTTIKKFDPNNFTLSSIFSLRVWFERSLHSAHVSRQSCSFSLKPDDVTNGGRDVDPHGQLWWLRGEWVEAMSFRFLQDVL